MKLIINKINSSDAITLDLESTPTVNELLLTLYAYRSKNYEHLSFSEYQTFISLYQCLIYKDRFKTKLLPGTNLSDYKPQDPCYLTWEEFNEKQCLLELRDFNSLDSKFLFWQTNMKTNEPEIEKESVPVQSLM